MIRDEDPHIRKMFQEQLAKEGADFNVPEEAYLKADRGRAMKPPRSGDSELSNDCAPEKKTQC